MIKKAIITAAGRGTRQYPATNAVQKEMFPLVDRDGITKPTIQIIIEEALKVGVEDIAVIVQPGEEKHFKSHFEGLTSKDKKSFSKKSWALQQSDMLEEIKKRITFIYQSEQKGFGHAVFCANEWVNNESVLLLLGDHVYISHNKESCTQQLVNIYSSHQKSVFGVQQTPIDELYLFGTVTGHKISKKEALYELAQICEKPTQEYARQHLVVADLEKNMFLTIFGMYILKPIIFKILEEHILSNKKQNGEIQLTTALDELIKKDGALGYNISGTRLDMGTPLGYLQTQVLLALYGIYGDNIKNYFKNYL